MGIDFASGGVQFQIAWSYLDAYFYKADNDASTYVGYVMSYYSGEIYKLQLLSAKCTSLDYHSVEGTFISNLELALELIREPVVCPNGHHSRDYCGLRNTRPPTVTSSDLSKIRSNPPSLFNTYQGPTGCWDVDVQNLEQIKTITTIWPNLNFDVPLDCWSCRQCSPNWCLKDGNCRGEFNTCSDNKICTDSTRLVSFKMPAQQSTTKCVGNNCG